MKTATFEDRRNLRRFDTLFVLEFRSMKNNEGHLLGLSRNFSAKGLSFESKDYKEVIGEILEFKLGKPGDGGSVSFMGKIAWKKIHDNYDCLTGIKLITSDSSTVDRILSIVSSSEYIPASVYPQKYSNEPEGIDQPHNNIKELIEWDYSQPDDKLHRKYNILNKVTIIILLFSLYMLYMVFSYLPNKYDVQVVPLDVSGQGEEILLSMPEKSDFSSIMSPERFRFLFEQFPSSSFKSAVTGPPETKAAVDRPEGISIIKQYRTKRRPPAKNTYPEIIYAQTEKTFLQTKSVFSKEVGKEVIQTDNIISPSGSSEVLTKEVVQIDEKILPFGSSNEIDAVRVLDKDINISEDSPSEKGPEEIQPEALKNMRIADSALIIRAENSSSKLAHLKSSVLPYLVVAVAPRIFFEDHFENSNSWPVIDTGSNTAFVEDGSYFIESRADGSEFNVIGPDINAADDHRIDIKLSNLYGAGNYSYGFIWGALDYDNYYSFMIKDNGEYTVSRTSNSVASVLTFGNRSLQFLDRKGNNMFSVKRRGSNTSFYINDNFIYEISGLKLYGGRAGFIVDGMCRIEVENIRITSAE